MTNMRRRDRVARKGENLFTCIPCQANWNVKPGTTACPVCDWSPKRRTVLQFEGEEHPLSPIPDKPRAGAEPADLDGDVDRGAGRTVGSIPATGAIAEITNEMVDRAVETYAVAISAITTCPDCGGSQVRHYDHDPEWCGHCGGAGYVPAGNERDAMREALRSALTTGNREP